jgi:hypothetical protein
VLGSAAGPWGAEAPDSRGFRTFLGRRERLAGREQHLIPLNPGESPRILADPPRKWKARGRGRGVDDGHDGDDGDDEAQRWRRWRRFASTTSALREPRASLFHLRECGDPTCLSRFYGGVGYVTKGKAYAAAADLSHSLASRVIALIRLACHGIPGDLISAAEKSKQMSPSRAPM